MHVLRAATVLSALCLALLPAGCGGEPPDAPPIAPTEGRNVVLIVVDTLRADAVEGSWTETPAIAALAADGVRFGRAFSHAPITLPSHTALFASRPPYETGVLNNAVPVREDMSLLADWMQRHGYQTHAVMSLGTLNPRTNPKEPGLARGFEHFDNEYWNMALAEDSIERMRRRLDALEPDKPFFLFAHYSDPHEPYNTHEGPPEEAEILLDGELLARVPTSLMSQHRGELHLEAGQHEIELRSETPFKVKILDVGRYDDRCTTEWIEADEGEKTTRAVLRVEVTATDAYAFRYWLSRTTTRKEVREVYKGEVEYVDRYVGVLLDELRARGLYEDSLVVFTADHGEALGEHGAVGHIQNLHDPMLNVPLIIKLPAGHGGRERLQREAGRLVPHLDLVPTILEIVGLPPMAGQQGSSLLGDRSRLLLAQTHKPEAKRNLVCLRDDRFKMIYDADDDAFSMFDLQADPEELVDVYGSAASERPKWPSLLRQVARQAAEGVVSHQDRTPEELEELEALGYVDGDADD